MIMPSMRVKGSPSISMRSAKVPLSPSSALQTMYFWSACALATVAHFTPQGNPAPPRPRRAPLRRRARRRAGASRRSREGSLRPADHGVELVGVEPPHELAVEHRGGAQRAVTQAIDVLDRQGPVRRGLARREAVLVGE